MFMPQNEQQIPKFFDDWSALKFNAILGIEMHRQ